MNVELPLCIYAVSEAGSQSIKIPSKESRVYQQHQAKLAKLFLDEAHFKNGAIHLFKGVDQRLEFLAWLLDAFIQNQDPRQATDFYTRLDEDRLISLPEGNGKSSVFPLIHGLFNRVNELILSLLDALERSIDGKLFLFTHPIYEPFSGERYLHNLSALADKGNWLAQVLQTLIFKLNIYEQAYTALKAQNGDLAYPEHWPVRRVNLSSGGLAIESDTPFMKHESVYVLLQLGQNTVGAKASVVSVLPIGSPERPETAFRHRVAFEFDNIDSNSQSLITQFVRDQELASVHSALR